VAALQGKQNCSPQLVLINMVNGIFLVGPVFLRKPHRIVSLIFLIMVGCLVARLIQRQVRRVLAELQEPIRSLMPEGRDNLRPTVERLFRAFAHYGLVRVKGTDGTLIRCQFAKLDSVPQQVLDVWKQTHFASRNAMAIKGRRS